MAGPAPLDPACLGTDGRTGLCPGKVPAFVLRLLGIGPAPPWPGWSLQADCLASWPQSSSRQLLAASLLTLPLATGGKADASTQHYCEARVTFQKLRSASAPELVVTGSSRCVFEFAASQFPNAGNDTKVRSIRSASSSQATK